MQVINHTSHISITSHMVTFINWGGGWLTVCLLVPRHNLPLDLILQEDEEDGDEERSYQRFVDAEILNAEIQTRDRSSPRILHCCLGYCISMCDPRI